MLRRVVGGHPLDRRDDHLAGPVLGLVAGLPLDRTGQSDRVVLGVGANRLEDDRLCVCRAHPADALERRHLLRPGSDELLADAVEVALLVQQLAIALLEHVRALVQLLVAGQEPALQGAELGALRARLLLRLALEAQLLILGLEDQVLLLGARLGQDAAGLLLGPPDRLGRDDPASDESDSKPGDDGHQKGHRRDDGVVHVALASRPAACAAGE